MKEKRIILFNEKERTVTVYYNKERYKEDKHIIRYNLEIYTGTMLLLEDIANFKSNDIDFEIIVKE